MKTIINRDDLKILNTKIEETTYAFKFTPDGKYKQVDLITIVNDNLPNCPAHVKSLRAEEMYAIYEYMKKIVEGA